MSEYRYDIKKIFQPAPDKVIIEAGPKSGRPVFSYRPGQYALISYRNRRGQLEDKHAFSLASSPTDTKIIRFGIKLEGSFTRGLLDLQVGDELRVFGPYGNFCYEELKHRDAIMIAGGIGITPFFSALNYATDLRLNNKLSLIYSARTREGAVFYRDIQTLKKRNPYLKTRFSFTEEKGILEPDVISSRIDASVIKSFIGDAAGKTFFICGPSLFMAAMTANLLSLGVFREQIKMEEFSMIPDKTFSARLKNMAYACAFSIVVFLISFSLIKPSASADDNQTQVVAYDSKRLSDINQANYERLISIYDAKNKALADLNQQLTKAAAAKPSQTASAPATNNNQNNQAKTTATTAATPTVTPVLAPVYTPPSPPVYNPPMPQTGMSQPR